METRQIRYAITASNQTAGPFGALKRDLSDLSARTANLGSGFSLFLRGLAGGAAIGAVANLGSTVRRLADDLDALNDSSDATGETVEKLSGLEDVARRNGGSLDLVTSSLQRLNKTLNEAKPGSPMAETLKAIGLNAAELRKLSPGDALLAIAQQLDKYANDGNKARLMQELFGKSSREMASFLKDLAEAGRINATVTQEQTDAAEKFNKQLAGLSTNASNAARGLVSEMLPALSDMLTRFESSRKEGTLLLDTLRNIASLTPQLAAVRSAEPLFNVPQSSDLQRLQQLLIGKQNVRDADEKAGRAENEENTRAIKSLERRIELLKQAQTLRSGFVAGQGVNPAGLFKPSVGDTANAGGQADKKRTTEAQRYLEALQRQGEQMEELTAYEKVLRDISQNRIEGIELPGIKQQIVGQAQLVDLLRLWNKQKEDGIDAQKRLNAEIERERSQTEALLDDTDVGKAERAARDIARIRKALQDPANQSADFGLRAIEAIERIKAGLGEAADEGTKDFDRLVNAIEKTMDRATDAVIDFAVDGQGSVSGIFKAFRRDVLRELISDPLRDEMKAAARIIRDAFKDLAGANNPLRGLFGGAGGAGGSGVDLFGAIGKLIIPAFGFANGGRAKAGTLLKVNENGTEGFIPDQDGTIVSGSQLGRASVAGAPLQVTNYWTVNGDVSPQTIRAMERMIDRNNSRLLRSARTGGAFAVA